jgi:hypothetical protein
MRTGSFLFTLTLFASLPAFAQDTGRIIGVVRDPSGGALPGATVTATRVGTGQTRTTTTNPVGMYEFTTMPIGEYRVQVVIDGFKTTAVDNLVLHIGQDLRVDIELQLGQAAETVNVVGTAPLTQTRNAEIGTVIAGESVRELPLNGRNILQLALLAPGVTEAEPQSGIERFTFTSGGFTVSVNGGRTDQNLYTLDGVWNGVVYFNQQNILPTVEAVSEFRVRGTNADASHGFGHGGIISYATVSGQNRFRGKAWEFLRDDALDAKNYFDIVKPPFRQNQFGGILSGPVVRNRVFFMASYEGLRIRKGLTALNSIPTRAQIAGDFNGGPIIYDPLTTRPDPNSPGRYIRDAFPGNRIAANRIHPASAFLASFFPPTDVGGPLNYVNNAVRRNDRDQYNLRLDYRLSGGGQIFGRLTTANFLGIEPLGPTLGVSPFNPPNLPTTQRAYSRNLALGWTHTLSSKMLNEFRFGYNRANMPREQRGPDFYGMFNIPGSNRDPNNFGLPAVSVTSLSQFGGTDTITPFLLAESDYQFVNEFSIVRNNHIWLVGGSFMRTNLDHQFDFFSKASANFQGGFTADPNNAQRTGHAFADFLLGIPSTVRVGLGKTASHSSQYRIEAYLNDTWTTTPRLTLNWGVRYEVMRPPLFEEPLSTFDANTGNIVIYVPDNSPLPEEVRQFPTLTFVKSRDAGYPDTLVDTDKNNVSGRFAATYALQENATTVLRGGYGLFYAQRQQINSTAQFRTDVPFYNIATIINGGVGFAANPVSLFPTVTWDNLLSNPSILPGGTTFPRSLPFGEIQQWNVSLQRQLLSNTGLEVAYVGSRGRKLMQGFNPNQVDLLGQVTTPGRRPFPLFGNFTSWKADGKSSYKALILSVRQQYQAGFMYQASYTLSESLDTSSGENVGGGSGNGRRNSYDSSKAEWGRSNFDSTHRFVISYLYELPVGRGKRFLNRSDHVANLLGGWSIGGITILSSGVPFTASMAFDPTGLGLGVLPDVVGDPNKNAPKTATQWFDTSVFRVPTNSYGNHVRNSIHGPGITNFDFFLAKMFKTVRDVDVAFKAEFFNAFNKAQFLLPRASFGAADFGSVIGTREPREIQLSLNVTF